MTPAELYDHLLRLDVVLTPKPDGTLRVSAPVGALTPELRATIKWCKPALWVLAQLPQQHDAYLPWPSFRSWVTGAVPHNGAAITGAPLPPPTVHDTPHPPMTFIGKPCDTTRCPPSAQYPSGAPASARYRRTGLCVACLERLMKQRS